MSDKPDSSAPAPVHTRLESFADYERAVDRLLEGARRTVRVFDRTLEESGFNSVRREELLRRLLLGSRGSRLMVVIHEADRARSACPRFIRLLSLYSHIIEVRETGSEAKGVAEPFVVLDDGCFVRRFHFDDSRGLAGEHDPATTGDLILRFTELWQASHPALPATTLGL